MKINIDYWNPRKGPRVLQSITNITSITEKPTFMKRRKILIYKRLCIASLKITWANMA